MLKPNNIQKLAKTIILQIIIFTVVNIALLLNGSLFNIPFTLYSSQLFALWSSYSFEIGNNSLGILFFVFFFLSIGTLIFTYSSLNQKPKMVGFAFVVFLLDTLIYFWLTHIPDIFDPLILLMIITLLILLYLIFKYPKHLGLVILLMAVNIVVLVIVNSDLVRSVIVFDLIFKVSILLILGKASLIAFKKEIQL